MQLHAAFGEDPSGVECHLAWQVQCLGPFRDCNYRFPHWHAYGRYDVVFVFGAIVRAAGLVMFYLATRDSASPLYPPHFHYYIEQFTFHSTLYTLHSTFYTPHSTLPTFHFPIYTPHSTLHTSHFTLHGSPSGDRRTDLISPQRSEHQSGHFWGPLGHSEAHFDRSLSKASGSTGDLLQSGWWCNVPILKKSDFVNGVWMTTH